MLVWIASYYEDGHTDVELEEEETLMEAIAAEESSEDTEGSGGNRDESTNNDDSTATATAVAIAIAKDGGEVDDEDYHPPPTPSAHLVVISNAEAIELMLTVEACTNRPSYFSRNSRCKMPKSINKLCKI
jgi:hypothetical protein